MTMAGRDKVLSLAAARNRRSRARRKDGLAMFPLLVDDVAMTEALVEEGWPAAPIR